MALPPPPTASGSMSRKRAAARRSSSCTSSAATIAAGSRRCASSRAAIAASPLPRAAIRPRTCPTSVEPIRRRTRSSDIARGDGCARHRRRRTSSACRWAASRRCISGCATPQRALSLDGRRRGLRRREGVRGRISATSRSRSPTSSRSRARRSSRRSTRSARAACSSRTRIRAAGRNSPTGSASIRRVGAAKTMRGVQARRPSIYDLEDALRQMHGADAGGGRRRGRPLPAARHLPEEDDSGLRPRGAAEDRPHAEPRGAGCVQRAAGRVHRQVEAGRWLPRDPRALPGQIMRTELMAAASACASTPIACGTG